MTRVAAVDCGTNTIRLLVADIDPVAGIATTLVRETQIVRLGEGVDRTGRLADDAVRRVFAAAEQYAALATGHGVEAMRFVATSAARDADNAEAFMAGIEQRLGVRPEVLTGAAEAELTFDGATRALPDVPGPVVVVDIGGGSTEVVLGSPALGAAASTSAGLRTLLTRSDLHGRSLDVGSVRLTERLMPSDPPTAREVGAAAKVVDEALDTLPEAGVHVDRARTLVGVAGTVTTMGMLLLGLLSWDRERVHRSSFPVTQVDSLVSRLLAMTVAEREALGVKAGRSDVIGAGALILERVLRRSSCERLTVCDADILDGVAWSIA